ncbi:MAG: hypothetical protein JWM17_3315, partial [Actinobacteria bacterium]|nr:hypothetical protein [Actinomycetota bacterium]
MMSGAFSLASQVSWTCHRQTNQPQ